MSKQKINTKSSTKAELVGVDYIMAFFMWMNHFFQSQVRSINLNSPLKLLGSNVTVKQDNISTIQLEKMDGSQVTIELDILQYDTFISLTDSKQEMSVELFTSQLKIWEVIIL